MSMQSWSVDGYGVCLNGIIDNIQVVDIRKLLQRIPNIEEDIDRWFNSNDENPLDINSYINYNSYHYDNEALAWYLVDIIKEREYIQLYADIDQDGNEYLLYCPIYPWEYQRMTPEERELTPTELERIIKKYVGLITDKDVSVGYESVEHFG